MNFLEIVIAGILSLWLGSMEYRMKQNRDKIESKLSKKDAVELIDLKQEVIKSTHADLKEDLKELKSKLDSIDSYLRS